MFLDEYIMDRKNMFDEWERQQNAIGKYPPGFRHYENFVNYRQVNADATIEDYMHDMNREATYAEFLAIMRSSILEDSKQYKYELHSYDHNDLDDKDSGSEDEEIGPNKKERKNFKQFLKSELFEKGAKQKFNEMQYSMMTRRKIFKLVDCLEETMDLWSYGRNFKEMPVHNAYIPVKTTLMAKPKFDDTDDEFGIRLIDRHDKTTTTPRINPLAPLSPLKGIRMSPSKGVPRNVKLEEEDAERIPKDFRKWRRISHVRGFK